MLEKPEQYPDLTQRLSAAREQSWRKFGRSIRFYLPGMFSVYGHTGRYPALSITGNQCALQCDHCQGRILASMDDVSNPERLVERCLDLADRGAMGVLLSGGCGPAGELPWNRFYSAIRRIKRDTHLFVSVHCGLVDLDEATGLKEAGVNQALIDVIGDDDTYRQVYHVSFGVDRIEASLSALDQAGLPLAPHIVCGLHYGQIRGEQRAIDMVKPYRITQLVFVSLMGIPHTPMWRVDKPSAEAVALLIAQARAALPDTLLSLGCARQRGYSDMEILAIDAGVNRLALPSEKAVAHAKSLGLDITFQKTCCSVPLDLPGEAWCGPDAVDLNHHSTGSQPAGTLI